MACSGWASATFQNTPKAMATATAVATPTHCEVESWAISELT